MTDKQVRFGKTIEITEADILAAMREIPGYIDISPGDFREVFQAAMGHALRCIASRTARDIMTSPVHTVDIGMDLIQTAALFADKGISGAPVIDGDGKVAGVVSEKDFVSRMGLGQPPSFMRVIAHCLHNKGCVATLLRNHGVAEIMTTPAITAPAAITVGEISSLFIERGINRLPIVDDNKRPIGIVTRSDLLHIHQR